MSGTYRPGAQPGHADRLIGNPLTASLAVESFSIFPLQLPKLESGEVLSVCSRCWGGSGGEVHACTVHAEASTGREQGQHQALNILGPLLPPKSNTVTGIKR